MIFSIKSIGNHAGVLSCSGRSCSFMDNVFEYTEMVLCIVIEYLALQILVKMYRKLPYGTRYHIKSRRKGANKVGCGLWLSWPNKK